MRNILPYITEGIPILLWGSPGTGKTSHVVSLAKEMGINCEVLIGSIMDPTDFGRPVLTKNDEVKIVPPPWAAKIHRDLKEGKESWLFLDELTCCPPSIQAALLRVVNEKRVGNLSLEGCKIISAANPVEEAADGNDLAPAMNNRFAHIDWKLNYEDWVQGELSGWGNPEKDLSEARALVCSWIEKSPASLLSPPKYGEEKNAYPSPRTWSMVIKLFRGKDVKKFLADNESFPLVESLIGKGATTEFFTWLDSQDLPNPKDVLDQKTKIPKRADQKHLCLSSVVSFVLSNTEQLPKAWTLFLTLRKDMAAYTIRKLAKSLATAKIDYEMTEDCYSCLKRIGE